MLFENLQNLNRCLTKSKILCVMHAHMFMCAMAAETEGQSGGSSPIALHFITLTDLCVGMCAYLWKPRDNCTPTWLASQLALELSPSSGMTGTVSLCLAFYIGAGDPNIGLYACVASIFLNEPSPWPQECFVKMFLGGTFVKLYKLKFSFPKNREFRSRS